MSTPTDRELVERLRAGSADAADELARRYLPRAFRAAVLITGDPHRAEDVVQDAFERAIRTIARFDADRPFGPWLHRIVANRAIDDVVRRDGVEPLDDDRVPARDPFALADSTRELIAALAELPAERRVVVVLRLLLGYTPAEVAEIVEVEVGTVHSRLSRGLAQLRERLGVSDGV